MNPEHYFKQFKKVNIPEWEVEFTAVRSSGPGGQNVNKTATKVQVSFDINTSKSLSDEQKKIIRSKLKNYINSRGELVLAEQSSRSQFTNRVNVFKKLENIINNALIPVKERVATGIPDFIQQKRVDEKKKKGRIKQTRGNIRYEDSRF
ncbi:MAG TPA: alternative ribosome rescue aminoacyl-tRNA hydrolase ArfB [Patescibacteria group bacterium]|nr:alternative ribosome rescue aminoacyl-tRNA hydrolase ArfB [Patescibacteria group bacterium]